jgi:hypothetical protein
MIESWMDGARAERITGPHEGFFVAAYAVESCGAFHGYAKICAGPPTDVWDCTACDKVAGPASPTPDDALARAEECARLLVDALARGQTTPRYWQGLGSA